MTNHWRRLAVVLIIVSCVAMLVWLRPQNSSLPETKIIESIVADGYYGPSHTRVEFDVPLEHWPRIRSCLEPATRDNSPAKWVGAGSLKIAIKDGRHLEVYLFETQSPPGAFAAGPTFEQRVYYRGGNSTELERSLAAALATANQLEKVRAPAE